MEESKKLEFEINKLVVSVYNKIAHWTNSDFDTATQKGDALKVVSQNIVQTVLEEFVSELGLQSSTSVFRGDTKIGDLDSVKDEESFEQSNDKDIIDKLFDK
jgi:hypothetical protein